MTPCAAYLLLVRGKLRGVDCHVVLRHIIETEAIDLPFLFFPFISQATVSDTRSLTNAGPPHIDYSSTLNLHGSRIHHIHNVRASRHPCSGDRHFPTH